MTLKVVEIFYILTVVIIRWNSELHTKEGEFHYTCKSGFKKKITNYKGNERKWGDTIILVFQLKKKVKWFGKATLLMSMLLILQPNSN